MKYSVAFAFFVLASLGVAQPAAAHGPTPQKSNESIVIAVPPAEVWKAVKDFAKIDGWHPGVAKSVAGGDKETSITRTLTLKSGGDIVEGLDELDDANLVLGYRLSKENVDAFPVGSYSASMKIVAAEGGSEVRWMSRLYRADTTNEPPPEKNDEAALKAMSEFFKQGLEGLKKKLESKG